jgi:hypothetical protein
MTALWGVGIFVLTFCKNCGFFRFVSSPWGELTSVGMTTFLRMQGCERVDFYNRAMRMTAVLGGVWIG